jgi:hypothetical protein
VRPKKPNPYFKNKPPRKEWQGREEEKRKQSFLDDFDVCPDLGITSQ